MQNRQRCPQCNVLLPRPHPFLDWVDKEDDLDSIRAWLTINDFDIVVHSYKTLDCRTQMPLNRQHAMIIELKRGAEPQAEQQKDIFCILNQLLEDSRRRKVRAWKRGKIQLFWHGIHILRTFDERITPGSRIRWDNKDISVATLKDILRFQIDARTLRPREDRSHHRGSVPLKAEWCTGSLDGADPLERRVI